jgi:outer membrane receptor protein involved in Fe transport
MKKSPFLVSTLLSAGLLASAPAFAQDNSSGDSTAASRDQLDEQNPREIIVTGVFTAQAIESAPISINVVTAQQLAQLNPVSAADLLKNVPGVFVNSALGEIRNVVFSRGVSANSLDGAGGYYYVSLQEDGLPVDLITNTNYGPDYYLRSDITLARLEGLRGGTAAVTGPNAPGGIFNYISKNGKSNPGVEVQARYGLQGDASLPQYRVDAYAGGQLTDNLYYSIGGFLRTDKGTHDANYTLNKGGQVKANLLYNYSSGSLELTGKFLDDANTWNEFTPAFGGKKIAPGFSNTTSDLQPKDAAHCYPVVGGGSDCWDPTDLVRNRAMAVGLNWKQDLGGTFHLDNKMRYSRNKSIWNAGAVLSVVSLQDPIVNLIMGTGFLQPGTLNYYRASQLVASQTVNDNAGGGVFAPGYFTVNSNNLPNQNILDSSIAGGIGSYVGFSNTQHSKSRQFEDQLTVTGDVGNHHLAFGGFVGLAKITTDFSRAGGIGLMTLTPQPQMLTVTYQPDGSATTYYVTDPTGFGGMGQPALTSYTGTQRQFSVFAGDTWEITPALRLEAGGRWEAIRYDVKNQTWASNVFGLFPLGFGSPVGGVDGDPLTLYDNGVSDFGPVLRTKRNFDYFNYSLAVDYDVSSSLSTYVRFTNGKKAPDFGGIQAINTQFAIDNNFPQPQKIQQLEVGIKYNDGGISIQAFPFYSLLKNVSTSAVFTYGATSPQAGQQYFTPAIQGQIKTYGIEIAADVRLTPTLRVGGNATIQNPRASHFGTWTQGPKQDGTDDVFTPLPEGVADNNPKLILRGNVNWQPVERLNLFGNVSYLGKRAANAADAFYMPGFTTVDMGLSFDVTENVKFQFNVNNVFNEVGIMSWSRTGFLASLDRQGLTKAGYAANPNQLLPVVPSQARSLFWTITGKF